MRRPREDSSAGVPGKRGHPKAYPIAFLRQVRDAWVSGEFASDTELAAAFGLPRPESIAEWRGKGAPDGVAWEELRARMTQASLDVVAQRLGESNADATLRHIKIVRAAQTTVARYVFGQRLELADGTTMTIPSVEPRSLGEAVHSYCELVKMERHMRGEPDVRVDHYLHLIGEVVGDVALAFVQEMGLPEQRAQRFEALFQDRLQNALAEQSTKLLTEGGEWKPAVTEITEEEE